MRVLHVISDENIGGAGVLLLNLLRYFDKARVQSTVALPEGSALTAHVAALEIPTVALSASCDRLHIGAVRELCTVIQRGRFDLIHANAALAARVAARLCRVPVVHTRHCCFPSSGIWRIGVVRAMGGVCNRLLSDRVIATADAAAQNLRALGIPNKKIRIIINGSEPVRAVSDAELAVARERWGLFESDVCIGICARLVACKGHHIFLEAARLALQRAPQMRFRFLIAGEGAEREALEQLTGALGLTDVVRFLGFLEDPAPFYRLLRIHVNCSTGTETSCLAVSEAMSAGVVTVAGNFGGIPAMIEGSGAGILCPVGDASAFADAFVRIATDSALEQKMRAAAKVHFDTHFTAARMADEVTALYCRVCKGNDGERAGTDAPRRK